MVSACSMCGTALRMFSHVEVLSGSTAMSPRKPECFSGVAMHDQVLRVVPPTPPQSTSSEPVAVGSSDRMPARTRNRLTKLARSPRLR